MTRREIFRPKIGVLHGAPDRPYPQIGRLKSPQGCVGVINIYLIYAYYYYYVKFL